MVTNTDAEGEPPRATTAAEFVHALRVLRSSSGLTYRQLEARARANGDVLPYSTLASALRRDTLPRRDVTAMFVRACGASVQEVERWLADQDRLAADPSPAARSDVVSPPRIEVAPARVEPPATATADPVPFARPERLRRFRPINAVAMAAGCAGLAGFAIFGPDLVRPPNVHWYSIRTTWGTCLDFTAKDQRGNPLVAERPCKSDPRPDQRFAWEQLGPETYRIKIYNPETNGSTWCIDIGEREQLRPQACTDSSRTQLFRLEAADGRWRIRPQTGGCFTVLAANGAQREVREAECAESVEQTFSLVPA
ncbi:hypothetical protein [Saccharopolyspora sp. NPDC002578]